MQRFILYIINPISGTRRKKDLQHFIEKQTAARGIPYQVFPSVASGDYRFLRPVIEEYGVTDIVIAGGDGTVSQVVGSLLDVPVNFGVIPCGSGNGLALAAGISRQPAKALQTVFTGQARAIDGFLINGRFSCMLCGLGFDASVAHAFASQTRRGLKTYAALVGRHFFSAKPYHFRIETHGLAFSSEAFFISIANGNQFGNHFTIAPKALLSDGQLDIVVVKKMAKPLLLLTILRQVLAGRLKSVENSLRRPVIYFQTRNLKISNPEGALLHIDGDPAETPAELEIRILDTCFRLICPL
ncbi:MAG TPA: diacylglycerol kinase family protein [Chitinophagaceae bacterium]|nr:diacylglycerol kinase family protein [Chitinophagaceae bacterium]